MIKPSTNSPRPNERVCPVSFELARIRLGGGPEERSSFWRVYREELALNKKTKYRNEHVRICGRALNPAFSEMDRVLFYRSGRLVEERLLPASEKPSINPPT